jgi:hexosaminidase
MGRIESFLNTHGRKMIGWDEIIEGGLSPSPMS